VLQVGIRAILVLSGPEPGDFSCCMRMVLSYLRYLLCFSVLLGGFKRSGGQAGCFRCVGSGKGRCLWMVKLVCL
jgi:hypothetical protein